MAITNEGVSGAHPSTWSAAIDQAAAGTMIGDDNRAPQRLFMLSTGNTVPVMRMVEWTGQDRYPVEDPSQAWNAVTIGGYTDFSMVTVYFPGCRSGKRNCPASLLVVADTRPVAVLRAVILAAAITAPVSSATVPKISAVVCANRAVAHASTNRMSVKRLIVRVYPFVD